ncbi:MAG: ribonuclease P protein component [Candidatus Taylorbacteria bacterium]|nr:ribonuclease P protein component [Candidatus Taylorbacteria bacterium]
MLPRSRTLRSEEFARVVTSGTPIHSPRFLMRIQKTGAVQSRFSVTIPKKVATTAVMRNLLRRRVYASLKNLMVELRPGYEGVLVLKTNIKDLSPEQLTTEIKNVLLKGSLI